MHPRDDVAGRASFFLLTIIYLGFVSLGLPDGTLGVAWPPMHRDLGLPIGFAGILIMLGTLFTASAAVASGKIIHRFSTGPVVLTSCLATGLGMMTISHATGVSGLVVAAMLLGMGAGAVDAGLNGFVARHYSGRHMNWLHACWGIGASCGPLVLAQALRAGTGWRDGYFWIAIAQLSLAGIFLGTLRLWRQVPEKTVDRESHENVGRFPSALANSAAGWLSLGIFGLYLGVEMTVGVWASSVFVVSRGFGTERAALCTAAFYGAITGGRVIVGLVVEHWGNRKIIRLAAGVAVFGAVQFLFATTLPLAIAAMIVLGLGLAPLYPCLMHEVPRRFAPEAVQIVIGRQSGAAAFGAATLPLAAGWMAERSLEGIGWMVAIGISVLLLAVRRLDRIT
jgi:MFS family permease